MKIVRSLLAIAVILFMGFVVLNIAGEWIHGIRRSRVASQIAESYKRSAIAGEVARPATNSDSIQCWSVCYWSMPNAVKVKSATGDTFFYIAERGSNSTAWSFRFVSGTDASGHSITNEPSI